MQPGDVIVVTNFEHRTADMRLGYRAPKGKTFVLVLIGYQPKDFSVQLDVGKALRDIGWVPGPELAEARPDL